MTREDTIAIELTLAERHTLHDLLGTYIEIRIVEDVQHARYSMDLEKAAARSMRLAHIKALAEGSGELSRIDLDALRDELAQWAAETESTVDEHDELIVKADENEELSAEEPGSKASPSCAGRAPSTTRTSASASGSWRRSTPLARR
jgi:hypothetical protein